MVDVDECSRMVLDMTLEMYFIIDLVFFLCFVCNSLCS